MAPRAPARPGLVLPLLPAGGVVLLVVAVAILSPAAPLGPFAGATGWASNGTFTNRLLDASPATGAPGLIVAPANASDPFGLNASLSGITEYRGTGDPVADAPFAHASWVETNSSSTAGFAVEYAATLDEQHAPGGAPIGRVGVYANFTAFAGTAASGLATSSVLWTIALVNWTYLKSTDGLAFTIPVAPNDSAVEHLSNGPTDTVDCVPNGVSTASEYLTWAADATGSNGSGPSLTVPTVAQITGSPASSTLSVVLAGANVSYTHLQYGLRVGVVLPAAHAAVSATVAAIGIGAAVAVTAVVWIAVRSNIGRPPRRPEAPPAR